MSSPGQMRGDDQPLISVVMPVRNGEPFIEEAILSVQAQTCPFWELIVEDDGSQDGTREIVERLAEHDLRIRYYRDGEGTGAAETRNRGFRHCKGEYVALLDCDDLWYPEKLERQLALIETSAADLVYCSYAIIDEAGARRANDFIVPETIDYRRALVKSVMAPSTVMMRRELVERIPFPTGFYHEDLCYWLLLLGRGCRAVGDRAVYAAYRVRKGSKSSNKLLTEWRRWLVYRKFCRFSAMKSTYLVVKSSFLGLYKYRPVRRRERIVVRTDCRQKDRRSERTSGGAV